MHLYKSARELGRAKICSPKSVEKNIEKGKIVEATDSKWRLYYVDRDEMVKIIIQN